MGSEASISSCPSSASSTLAVGNEELFSIATARSTAGPVRTRLIRAALFRKKPSSRESSASFAARPHTETAAAWRIAGWSSVTRKGLVSGLQQVAFFHCGASGSREIPSKPMKVASRLTKNRDAFPYSRPKHLANPQNAPRHAGNESRVQRTHGVAMNPNTRHP